MTAISPTSNSSYQSPLQKLEAELQSEVTSGAVSSSDQSALSSALNDINSSLQGGSASDSASSTSSSPGDLKSKIDTLIANEVSSGKLTSDQAAELQGVFKSAFANGGGSGDTASGPGGPGLPGGGVTPEAQATPAAPILVITAAMAVRRRPTVRPPPARAAPAQRATFFSSSCKRCRIRSRVRRRRPIARPVSPIPVAAARRSRRF